MTDKIEELEDGSIRAWVNLIRMSDGQPIGRGSGLCGGPTDSKKWANAPAFQVESMAITRATGKACRLAFSWIITMAGYDPTPPEEMNWEPKAQPVSKFNEKNPPPDKDLFVEPQTSDSPYGLKKPSRDPKPFKSQYDGNICPICKGNIAIGDPIVGLDKTDGSGKKAYIHYGCLEIAFEGGI